MLSVDFINVGYGDSILVRDAGGRGRDCPINKIPRDPFTLLIDSGDTDTGAAYPNSRRLSAADFLKREGVAAIDVLLLTHLHRDHIGGLKEIMESTAIKELWTNYLPGFPVGKLKLRQNAHWDADSNDTVFALDLYFDMIKRLHAKGAAFKLLNSIGNSPFFSRRFGEDFFIECTFADPVIYQRQNELVAGILSHENDAADVQSEFLHDKIKSLNSILNDSSIRAAIKYKDAVIALPGDVSASSWLRNQPPKCTVLKVPHHGHRDGLSEELVLALKPEYFVLSVSNDRKDSCPHPDSAAIIKKSVKKCFVTDALSIPGVAERNFHSSVRFEFDDRLIFAGPHRCRV
jgi:competence protein ComEC